MAKARRTKTHHNGKDRHPNASQATQLLREDHRRMEGYFDDMDTTEDALTKNQIRDLMLAEIRVHKAVVEEVFYPAVAEVLGEALADEAREELEELEPLLETVETTDPSDTAFEPAWQKLARQLAHHIQWEEQEILASAEENAELDLLQLGLRVAELRREVMAEQPTVNWSTTSSTEDEDTDAQK